MMRPKRIQLKRTKGWRMPANSCSVARPSKYGNPVTLAKGRKFAVRAYRMGVRGRWTALEKLLGLDALQILPVIIYFQRIRRSLRELRGKNLGCFCKLCAKHKDGLPLGVKCADCEPCHADTLLTIGNSD